MTTISSGYDINAAQERARNLYLRNTGASATTESDSVFNSSSSSSSQDDSLISDLFGDVGSGNTCTDGKDNGKIGPLSILGNIAQGAVRTIPTMIKGAFTSNGKFSLGKTLFTLGASAVSIACPAIGIFACGVGIATSVYNTGKNVIEALSAKTDAEAKAAWERVGQGAVTTVVSYRGMKASYGAMQKSAGGTSSNMSKLNGDTFFTKVKENGIVDTTRAFFKDSFASTKNNLTSAFNWLKSLPNKIKSSNANRKQIRTEYKDAKKDLKNAKKDLHRYESDLKNLENDPASFKQNGKWTPQASGRKGNLVRKINNANGKVQTATSDLSAAKSKTGFGRLTSTVNKYTQNTQATAASLATNTTKSSAINTVMNAYRLVSHPLKTLTGLSKDALAIAEALSNKTLSNEAIIAKFGYEAVSQALYALGGNAALGAIEQYGN